MLELAILGDVDERVDAAVGEHQHDGDLMVPDGKVETVGGETNDAHNLFSEKQTTKPQQTNNEVTIALRPAALITELPAGATWRHGNKAK